MAYTSVSRSGESHLLPAAPSDPRGSKYSSFFVLPVIVLVTLCVSCTSLTKIFTISQALPKPAGVPGNRSIEKSFVQAFLLKALSPSRAYQSAARIFAIVNTPSGNGLAEQSLNLPADAQLIGASLRSLNSEAKTLTMSSDRLAQELLLNEGQCSKMGTLQLNEAQMRGIKELKNTAAAHAAQDVQDNPTTTFQTNTSNARLLILKVPLKKLPTKEWDRSQFEYFVARPDAAGRVSCEGLSEDFVAGTSDGKSFEPALQVKKTTEGTFQVDLAPLAQVELTGSQNQSIKGTHVRLAIQRKNRDETREKEENELPHAWQAIQKVEDFSSSLDADSYYTASLIVAADTLNLKIPVGQYLASLTDFVTNETCIVAFSAVQEKKQVVSCAESKDKPDPNLPRQPPLREQEFNRNVNSKEETQPRLMLTIPTLVESHSLANSLNELFSQIAPQKYGTSTRRHRVGTPPPIAFGNMAIALPDKKTNVAHSPNDEAMRSHSAVLTYALASERSPSTEKQPAAFKSIDTEQLVLDNTIVDFGHLDLETDSRLDEYIAGNQIPEFAFLSNSSDALDPLLTQTRVLFSSLNYLSTENILTSVTNGVLFNWNSPEVTQSLVHLPPDGMISLSVQIPAYNLTDYVEIYVGTQLYKRYVVQRKNFRAAQTFKIEEYFDAPRDFQMTLYAWGKGYLPEFVHGRSRIRPRAILSRICFDVNKNSICDQTIPDQDQHDQQ